MNKKWVLFCIVLLTILIAGCSEEQKTEQPTQQTAQQTPIPTTTPTTPKTKSPDIVVYVEGDKGIEFQGSIMIMQGTKSSSKSVEGVTPTKYEFDNIDMVSVSFQKMSGDKRTLKVRILDPQSGEVLAEESTTASYGVVVLSSMDKL